MNRGNLLRFCKRYAKKIDSIEVKLTPLPLSYRGHTTTLLYIKFSNHKITKTQEINKGKIYIDYDRKGEVVGIEII